MNPFKPTPQKSREEQILFQKYSKYILGDDKITPFVIEIFKIDRDNLKKRKDDNSTNY